MEPDPTPAAPRATRFGTLAGPGVSPPQPRSYWVVEGRLAGGAYPYRAEPAEGDALLDRLLGAGITAFVDLTEAGAPGSPDGHLVEYRRSPRLHGLPVVRRPIPDFGVPTKADLEQTLDVIDGLLDGGRAVYVHCWGGIGRTGIVVGAWLIRHGAARSDDVLDVLAALRTADRVTGRYPAPQTPEQRAFLRGVTAG